MSPTRNDAETQGPVSSARAHFDRIGRSWRENYSGTLTFQSYNFLIRRAIVLEMFDREGGRFLDAGCGTGDFIPALLDHHGEVVALDFAAEMVAHVRSRFHSGEPRSRVHPVVGDVTLTSFPDRSFDAIIGVGLLEYVDDVGGALLELNRVLKPGGLLIATVPNLASPFMAYEIVSAKMKRGIRRMRAALSGHTLPRPFLHRHFFPWAFDGRLRLAGFHRTDYAFCSFGVFSARRLSPFFLGLSRRLERQRHLPIGIFGTNYIVKLRKT